MRVILDHFFQSLVISFDVKMGLHTVWLLHWIPLSIVYSVQKIALLLFSTLSHHLAGSSYGHTKQCPKIGKKSTIRLYYTRLEKFHDKNLLKTVNIKPLMRKILVQLPTNCTFLDFRKSYRVIPPWLLQQLNSSFSYMKRKLHCLRKMMEKIFC